MSIILRITFFTPIRTELDIVTTQAPGSGTSQDGGLFLGSNVSASPGSPFETDVNAAADGMVILIGEDLVDIEMSSTTVADQTMPRPTRTTPSVFNTNSIASWEVHS